MLGVVQIIGVKYLLFIKILYINVYSPCHYVSQDAVSYFKLWLLQISVWEKHTSPGKWLFSGLVEMDRSNVSHWDWLSMSVVGSIVVLVFLCSGFINLAGMGATSCIWHSTDVRAEYPPVSALPSIRLAPFFQQKVYGWPDFSWFVCERPHFSDIPVYAYIFSSEIFRGCLFSWYSMNWLQYLSSYQQ